MKRLKKTDPRPVHRFTVTIHPDYGMGLDNPEVVRGVIEEALRESGRLGASYSVEHQGEKK